MPSSPRAVPESGFLELPPAPGRPALRLEWNHERTRVLRDRSEILAFDPAGRPVSWVRDGVTWRRGLDGSVVEILPAREKGGFPQARRLAPLEVPAQVERVRAGLLEAWEALGHPQPLSRAVHLEALEDAREFRRIWSPVMILPPDQYRALVLQLTEGCSYNRCSFCTFYKDRPYRVRTLAEFQRHLEEALAFLGPGLSWRRGVFLADANAANIPLEPLLAVLEFLRQRLPGDPFARVSSFLDTFSSPRRTVEEWKLLAERGLDALYLGIETGSPRVLKLLRKPGSPKHIETLVGDLKQAGIRVGAIVMAGVGGTLLAREHVEETAALLNRLPLDGGDRIYLAEFEADPSSPYVQEALADLADREACRDQGREIRARLRFARHPRGPVISPYDVRQFVY